MLLVERKETPIEGMFDCMCNLHDCLTIGLLEP